MERVACPTSRLEVAISKKPHIMKSGPMGKRSTNSSEKTIGIVREEGLRVQDVRAVQVFTPALFCAVYVDYCVPGRPGAPPLPPVLLARYSGRRFAAASTGSGALLASLDVVGPFATGVARAGERDRLTSLWRRALGTTCSSFATMQITPFTTSGSTIAPISIARQSFGHAISRRLRTNG